MRLSVRRVIEALAVYPDWDNLRREYPELEPEDIRQALEFAAGNLGESVQPRAFRVPNLRNRGSGFPDMGLFVAARGMPLEDWPEARAPERGVVQMDDISADLSVKSGSTQVRRYLAAYGLVWEPVTSHAACLIP